METDVELGQRKKNFACLPLALQIDGTVVDDRFEGGG